MATAITPVQRTYISVFNPLEPAQSLSLLLLPKSVISLSETWP